MDKASDYESGDSRFESWRGQLFFVREQKKIFAKESNLMFCICNRMGPRAIKD